MTSYECCFSSGRQFVFAERTHWAFDSSLLLSLVGLLIGMLIGVTVSIGGVRQFELIAVSLATFATLRSYYLCFMRSVSSVDLKQFLLLCLLIAGILVLTLAVVRYSLLLDLGITMRCIFWCGVGLVVGLGVKTYQVLCCQEDQRKHHLRVCSPCPNSDAMVSRDLTATNSLEALYRFLFWILSWRWYALHDSSAQECKSSEAITVHNRTLKLIKVCFYASDDMCCWVPFGGVAGRCVGFIPAEQSHTFRPPRHPSESSSGFRLKVFQPGLFDKELACFSQARAGQTFAFFDVEGMVRRSRVFAATSQSLQKQQSEQKMNWLSTESSDSESEVAPPVKLEGSLPRLEHHEQCQSTGFQKADVATECGLMRRNRSAGDLQMHQRAAASDISAHSLSEPPNQVVERSLCPTETSRRAAPDEVVVRNRSNQEIRGLLFRSDDYCFVIPLVGHVMACGDCILPNCERRFNPRIESSDEFTLKVYSVGPGAKELTYVTVRRGHTYTFCDSLLS